MLLHYKNLGIVLRVVGCACDMLNSADLQDQQNRRFSHWEPFAHCFLIGRLRAGESLAVLCLGEGVGWGKEQFPYPAA